MDRNLPSLRRQTGKVFGFMCRIQPAFNSLLQDVDAQQIAIFAHAGVIRAVLALVFDSPEAALKCEIDPLSATRLRVLPDDQFSVVCINQSG